MSENDQTSSSKRIQVLVVLHNQGKMHEGGYCSGAELSEINEIEKRKIWVNEQDIRYFNVYGLRVIDIRCLSYLNCRLDRRCSGSGYCRSNGKIRVLYAQCISNNVDSDVDDLVTSDND